jgi:hypothetical protein
MAGIGPVDVSRGLAAVAALAVAVAAGGCAASGAPAGSACEAAAAPAGGAPSLAIGRFDGAGAPLDAPATCPVWRPPQGGVVVGFDVLGRGVPEQALELSLRVSDAATGELLGLQVLAHVPLVCSASGTRVAAEQMVAVTAARELADLVGATVVIEVKAWLTPTEVLAATATATLVDQVPAAWAP